MKTDLNLLKQHLRAIAKPRDIFENFESLLEVESYIEKQFLAFGYQVQRQAFQFRGHSFNNLIASQNPSTDKPRFIIGAHFDAVPGTDGADDNASGVAALLEAARLLSNTPAASFIDFIAFNAEEYCMIGSTHYVNQLKKQNGKLLGMISLEMVGFTSQEKGSQKIPIFLKPFYPNIGNFLALVSDWQSKSLLEKAKQAFQKIEDLPIETLSLPAQGRVFPEVRLSDHSPFWDAGYPALMMTDTSFFRNFHYHTPSDRIETLDLEFLRRVTEGVISLANLLFKPRG